MYELHLAEFVRSKTVLGALLAISSEMIRCGEGEEVVPEAKMNFIRICLSNLKNEALSFGANVTVVSIDRLLRSLRATWTLAAYHENSRSRCRDGRYYFLDSSSAAIA